MKDPIFLVPVFLFGIVFGSFINVLIYRLPRNKSIVRPGSSCPHCGGKIAFYENIPLISYVMLLGKCRHCRQPISIRYPAVELLTGLLAVTAIYRFGPGVAGFEAILLSFLFIAIFFIDIDFTIIPDFFTIPGIIIGLGISLLPGSLVNWSQSLIGLLVGGITFFLVGALGQLLFRKEALGFGDVKFAGMLGAFLGWQNLILVLILASFLGSVVGIATIVLSGRKGKSTYIPFGPFLVAGALIAMYFGDAIIRAYLDLIGV
jgi:leader peptidase (prepilin peptidase)/N-methyltransferase